MYGSVTSANLARWWISRFSYMPRIGCLGSGVRGVEYHIPSIHYYGRAFGGGITQNSGIYKKLYLFILPLPTNVATFELWCCRSVDSCFWSFDETGRSRCSTKERQGWGMPRSIAKLATPQARPWSWLDEAVYTPLWE